MLLEGSGGTSGRKIAYARAISCQPTPCKNHRLSPIYDHGGTPWGPKTSTDTQKQPPISVRSKGASDSTLAHKRLLKQQKLFLYKPIWV